MTGGACLNGQAPSSSWRNEWGDGDSVLAGAAAVRGLQQGLQVRHGDLLSAGRDGAAPTQPWKAKRTLGFDNLFTMLAAVLASSPVLLAALMRPKTSAALREKVMLGATSVTDCRYCAWGHGHWAMANGVSLEEVNQILGQQTESLQAKAPAEAAAILFAQHYAEHLEQFDPASIDNLRKHYSDAQVAEILAYVRTVTLGGLTGNTLDALPGRLRRMVRSRNPT
jgi:AhpD family alkylhydroperoxidase